MATRKTTQQFIEEAKKVHEDKYDYSKVEYIDCKTKVLIICPKHGEFWQRPSEHLRGHGCSKCAIEKIYPRGQRKWFKENIIIEAQKYNTPKEFRSKSYGAYEAAQRLGILKDLYQYWEKNKIRKANGYWNNYEHCKEEAKKYSSISEFQQKCHAGARYSSKNGWMGDFFKPKCKPKGYWNDYKKCKELAKTCKTISEFSKKSSAAYYWSRKNNWIEKFNWFIDKTIYNDNKVDCIYVYEFTEYNFAYIGRTLIRRIKERDKEHHRSMYIDKKGITHYTNDTVANFANSKNCNIPIIKILETSLTLKEGKIKEEEWCKIYKNNGWKLLNKAKTGKFSGSIGSLSKGKWTKEKCKEIALTCKTKTEFKQMNASAYHAARVNNWLKDYTWFINTSKLLSKAAYGKPKKWTYEKCYKLAKQCKTSSEFQSKSSRAYAAAKQYGWFNDYTWFVSGFSLITPIKWTYEKCYELAKQYKTKSEFEKKNGSAYRSARVNNWLKDYTWFKNGRLVASEKRRKYTYDTCFKIALTCKTKTEFKQMNASAYHAARVNNWLKDYTWFKNGRCNERKWSFDNIKKEAMNYIYKRDFMINSNVAYRKAKNNNYLNKLFSIMKFNFKGYFDNCGFDLEINSNIIFKNYKYIIFSSKESQKIIFSFYKNEMQQGDSIITDNLGKQYIMQTGFYDLFPKRPSWKKFKTEICPIILYSFEIDEQGIIILSPLNINENNNIIKNNKNNILKL